MRSFARLCGGCTGAKDAAYRDAERRGEVISILANTARKLDRLGYGLDGAPATAGESWPDTASMRRRTRSYQLVHGNRRRRSG